MSNSARSSLTARTHNVHQIITRGRYAGKKCVIISPLDNGTKSHPFPHALVAGIERYPSKVTRRMSKSKQAKKSKVKPFVKQVNCASRPSSPTPRYTSTTHRPRKMNCCSRG